MSMIARKWVFFFFSSRRRHTRWTGDWSSDVCSSDLDDFAIWIEDTWRVRRAQEPDDGSRPVDVGEEQRDGPLGEVVERRAAAVETRGPKLGAVSAQRLSRRSLGRYSRPRGAVPRAGLGQEGVVLVVSPRGVH